MTETLVALQKKNPDVEIMAVTDPRFVRYGRLLDGLSADKAIAFAREQAIPGERVAYQASVAGLEADEDFTREVSQQVYGGMPVQVGWCYGRNLGLAGLEYHKGSEVLVAVTNLVLLLGHFQHLAWEERVTYDGSQVEAFFVPQESAVELYSWALHLAPCHVHEETGFCNLCILPRGTNLPLDFEPRREGEAVMLASRNKWLFVRPGRPARPGRVAYVGLEGETPQLQAL
jgi:hypothetical protein